MTPTPRPTRPPRWARLAAVGLTVALAAGGCSLRTAGSPKGDLGLTATFDDVHNLVVGHSVKLADVTIGTVTHVRLDGYRAEVTMSIEDGHPLPVGTTAVLAKTSLLGEQYIGIEPGGDEKNFAEGDIVSSTQSAIVLENLISQFLFSRAAENSDNKPSAATDGAR